MRHNVKGQLEFVQNELAQLQKENVTLCDHVKNLEEINDALVENNNWLQEQLELAKQRCIPWYRKLWFRK